MCFVCPLRPTCKGKCQGPPGETWREAFVRNYPGKDPAHPLAMTDEQVKGLVQESRAKP